MQDFLRKGSPLEQPEFRQPRLITPIEMLDGQSNVRCNVPSARRCLGTANSLNSPIPAPSIAGRTRSPSMISCHEARRSDSVHRIKAGPGSFPGKQPSVAIGLTLTLRGIPPRSSRVLQRQPLDSRRRAKLFRCGGQKIEKQRVRVARLQAVRREGLKREVREVECDNQLGTCLDGRR